MSKRTLSNHALARRVHARLLAQLQVARQENSQLQTQLDQTLRLAEVQRHLLNLIQPQQNSHSS